MADGKFEKYSKLYPDIRLERHSGLLEVTFGVGEPWFGPQTLAPRSQAFSKTFQPIPIIKW